LSGFGVLITQCLQNDFVKPLAPYTPLPNLLHVGHEEARRLMGDDPAEGPIARFLTWALTQPDERLQVVHIRDWHDPTDPAQREHLVHFGPHCLRGTDGAAFAFPALPAAGKHVVTVDGDALNDFLHSDLAPQLARMMRPGTRLGIVGVWTEAKVTFLAYELRARYPDARIGVCAALTAGSSRAQHFAALDQLARLLDVEVFASVAGFTRFLGGAHTDLPLRPRGPTSVTLELDAADPPLTDEDRALVSYLFRDCRTARLRRLDGGFSGNLVLMAESVSLEGHPQAAHVVKSGPVDAIAGERTSFERIEAVLGNSAPRIVDFADYGTRGALKYRYASMGGGASTTFQQRYEAGVPIAEIRRILETVFGRVLRGLYATVHSEPCDLLAHYQFDARWAPSVRRRVAALVGDEAMASELMIAGRDVWNICEFYEHALAGLPRRPEEQVRMAWVHGDLNGANVILDAQGNVWLIDFFHTGPGHVLKDLLKLENDLFYIFTPLEDNAALAEAVALTDRLCEIDDLAAPLPPPEALNITQPALARAWQTAAILRSFYAELLGSRRNPIQALIAIVRYAVHTLSFDESDVLQKQWALYAAGRAARRLTDDLHRSVPLRVDWLDTAGEGRVGITILPGRRDRGRDAAADVACLAAEQVTDILCLLPDGELADYGVPDLLRRYRAAGLRVRQAPIADQSVPTLAEATSVVAWLLARIDAGGRVVVHCAAGLGRAGTVAACLLCAQGTSAEDAIARVRVARGPRAVETEEQATFVRAFQAAATTRSKP
jgi:protein-tyrosine phosphatase/nicotinamidase-related amidase